MHNDLIEMLTHRVRVLADRQLANTFCGGDSERANRLLSELEVEGYVERRSVLARPILYLEAPVIAWRPGAEKPHFGKAAYRLKSRWRESAMPTEIVRATTRAAQEFGGYLGGRWPRTSETTHDLNLAAVFLWHRTYRPEDATAWIPEAQLYAEGRGLGHRLPDAVIRMGGIDQRIVEFGGSYGKQKLQGFHAEMNTLPYEIW